MYHGEIVLEVSEIKYMQQGGFIGDPERAKPNKSQFEGSPSVGIHGQKVYYVDF